MTVNETHVVWRLEVLTAWSACPHQSAMPLLDARCNAKVTVHAERTGISSCLSGAVELALPTAGNTATATLPWNATALEAEAAINTLVPDGSTVMVHRSGDGHADSIFTVTFLGAGDWPTLTADATALFKIDEAGSSSGSDATAATAEVIPGGIDLLPLPGRYLTAPSSASVVSVRLKDKATATCGAQPVAPAPGAAVAMPTAPPPAAVGAGACGPGPRSARAVGHIECHAYRAERHGGSSHAQASPTGTSCAWAASRAPA